MEARLITVAAPAAVALVVGTAVGALTGALLPCLGCSLAVAAFAGLRANRCSKAQVRFEAFARQLADGDLTARLDVATVGPMTAAAEQLNTAVAQLQETLGNIVSRANTLTGASADLSMSQTSVVGSSDATNQRSATVAAAAEELTTNMTSMASSTEQVSASVRRVAEHIAAMSRRLEEMDEMAKASAASADDARRQVEASRAGVSELGTSAEQIGDVISVIVDIAEKTNLLALNATIEAARAGDAGKGFAVVATEVKHLAGQTADATDRIRDRIQSMQDSTGTAISQIEAINQVIENVVESSRQIAGAVAEQSSTTNEIARDVEGAASEAGVASTTVRESAAATDEIARSMTHVDEAARRTNDEALTAQDVSRQIDELSGEMRTRLSEFCLHRLAFDSAPIRAAHQAWKTKLADVMAGKLTLSPEQVASHRHCDFGRWYFGEGTKQFGHLEVFRKIDPAHEQVHEAARTITELCSQGRRDEAAEHFRGFGALTAELFSLLDELDRLANAPGAARSAAAAA